MGVHTGKIYAVIDVGSNSVRLLLADGAGERRAPVALTTTRLQEGLAEGMLNETAIARTADAVAEYARRAAGEGAARVFVFATSAVRSARNADAFLNAVRARTGLAVDVLSGEREAHTAFAATARPGPCATLDIGGGSTEMIVGTGGEPRRVTFAESAHIGAVKLRRELGEREDMGEMIGAAGSHLARVAAGAAKAAREAETGAGRPCVWTGVGGTITSLAAQLLGLTEYAPERVQDFRVDAARAREHLASLCAMGVGRRALLPGMPPGRADIMPFGTAILCAFFELVGASHILVSDRDNLEGYLAARLGAGATGE